MGVSPHAGELSGCTSTKTVRRWGLSRKSLHVRCTMVKERILTSATASGRTIGFTVIPLGQHAPWRETKCSSAVADSDRSDLERTSELWSEIF
jgi:hypothetical protein